MNKKREHFYLDKIILLIKYTKLLLIHEISDC
jgi:hypothetical protein